MERCTGAPETPAPTSNTLCPRTTACIWAAGPPGRRAGSWKKVSPPSSDLHVSSISPDSSPVVPPTTSIAPSASALKEKSNRGPHCACSTTTCQSTPSLVDAHTSSRAAPSLLIPPATTTVPPGSTTMPNLSRRGHAAAAVTKYQRDPTCGPSLRHTLFVTPPSSTPPASRMEPDRSTTDPAWLRGGTSVAVTLHHCAPLLVRHASVAKTMASESSCVKPPTINTSPSGRDSSAQANRLSQPNGPLCCSQCVPVVSVVRGTRHE